MNMQSYRIELYGHIIDLPATRVFANSIHRIFNPIEKNWHNRIINDFYKIFENLDDVYENSEKLAQDVLSESVKTALDILTENSIYDVDEQGFTKKYLGKYEIWDEYFEIIAYQYESIVHATAQKDAYRTQRRLNRDKMVGFGPAPSMKNGYRSPQSYANFSNAVDNIGHGIFNMMAKGVTAIENSIKKDEIFKNPKTVKALDSAVCSIILASKEAVTDALKERYNGAIHTYTKEEIEKASAIITNVENDRIPKTDIQKQILSLFTTYPYNERIYTLLLTRFGADAGKLDEIAEYFGISILADEKEKIFQSKLNEANLSSIVAIQSNISLFREFANNIGYSGGEKDLKELLDAAREKEFQLEAAKYQLRTPSECDQNLATLEKYAQKIGYSHFSDWATQVRKKLDMRQCTVDGIQYTSRFNADYAQKQSQKLRDTLGRRGFLWINECPYNKNKVIRAAKIVIEGTSGMKLIRADEASGVLEGKSSVSLLSWGESFRIQIGGEEEASSAVLLIQSDSKSSFAGTNKNKEIINKLAEQIRRLLDKFSHEWR
ncbi:hypothetical protein [Alicycliphilus denitrificans]|uniref:hypothetical protein n=1 Tax=Alicycliphilus denitrificans TaxID=179636 RepID=UPI00384EA33C